MPKKAHSAPVPSSASSCGAITALRVLASTPHPDARLLVTCDRFAVLREERELLYRKQARGYMNRVREMAAEIDALEIEIADTPARTAAGRRAKADAAMYMLGMTGTIARIARSAMQDFINASAQEGGA